ncbi:MAG TPA: RDD family protein [Flavisolibacter sp.]|nr:RDD family protein [Flavisolibacter sp.]
METSTLHRTQTEQVIYPTLADRVQSTFIDSIFIIVLMFVFASWLDRYENAPDWIRIVLFFGLWGIYEPLATALGGTIGNHLKGIRVRQSGNEAKRLNVLKAFFRYVVKIGLGWISFITIHSNPQKRAIHDLVAGSVMIKK